MPYDESLLRVERFDTQINHHAAYTFWSLEGVLAERWSQTYASLMIRSGAHAKRLQQLMGHEGFKVTMDTYAHLFPSDLNEAVANFEAYLSGSR